MQSNLDEAYARLADVREKKINANRAIAAYRGALRVLASEKTSESYARVQSGLAAVLGTLATLKLFCFCPDFLQILRVDYSFVLAKSFIHRVHGSRFGFGAMLGRIALLPVPVG